MRITYVARSFLDYRIPVLEHLNILCGNQLRFISSTKWTPSRALERLRETIGNNAVYLSGEKSIGVDMPLEANVDFCIPYQPNLLRSILKTRPDVLIGDGFFQWTYAALLVRIMKGIPLVVCYERWAHVERNAQWYRKIYRKIALNFVDAVCCNGSLSKEYTISLGMPAERVTTGHMAADTGKLRENSLSATEAEKEALQLDFDLKGTVYLYMGQLIARKGIAHLVDAWAELEKTGADATLLIVGGGPEEHALKDQLVRLGLRQVCFAGPVDYNRIGLFYASADAFIIPTLEDNWSLVVPEAMACGLPILCSKYNGCWPELVQEGMNGWVFDPLDTADLLRVLLKTFRCRDQLKSMGVRSKEIVAAYSSQKAAEAIFACCKIALSGK